MDIFLIYLCKSISNQMYPKYLNTLDNKEARCGPIRDYTFSYCIATFLKTPSSCKMFKFNDTNGEQLRCLSIKGQHGFCLFDLILYVPSTIFQFL